MLAASRFGATLAAIVASAAIAAPSTDDGDWTMAAHDYANTRFSPLDEIRPENAARLELAFSFSTGIDKGHEAAPVVVNATMYVVTPYPNYVLAFDLSKPGANLKWKFDPHTKASAQGVACCDVVNRGAAYARGPPLLQYARQPGDRARRGHRQGALAHAAGRHPPRADDHHGATPPGHALAEAGLTDNVRGFLVYGDGPAAQRMVAALASGELDAALVWGPQAGYFAAHAAPALEVHRAHPDKKLDAMPFEFDIAMGVRRGDRALRDELDAVIGRRRADIDAILAAYSVPRTDRSAP